MRRCDPAVARALTSLAVLAMLLIPRPSIARDGEPRTTASVSAAPRRLAPDEEAAPLPAGHPAMPPQGVSPGGPNEGEEDSEGMFQPEPGSNPHAGTGAAPNGMFQPPPDTAEEDPSLPSGTIAVDVRDPDNQAIPNTNLLLVILHQSVAKGQSKENRPVRADAGGHLRLDHLEVGTAVSYWIKAQVGPATFATPPVQLTPSRGMRLVLHVYPVARDVETALIVMQGVLYFEVKDDRVQAEEVLTLFNFGKTAFFPDNLVIRLPPGFTALTSQSLMSDQGIDAVEAEGAKIRGTFAPGRHDLEFRWQLPYDGERDVSMEVGLPPHIAVMRVMAAAGRETTLVVDGFPEPQRRSDVQGQHVLITEKQVRRDEPITAVHVAIRGLLTPGPARIVATCLASLTVLMGLAFAFAKRPAPRGAGKTERARLLSDLERLERAHQAGDVGPRAYQRGRRDLIDAIAETLDATSPPTSTTPVPAPAHP